MAKVTMWTGSASDLHRFGADRSPDGCSSRSSGWPKSPRALAGRLRPILGALLEAASHGLRTLSGVRLKRLPRMADFALWATACETTFWPSGTFVRAYDENRKVAIEGVVEADPVADHVRETTWTVKCVGPLLDRCRSFDGWMPGKEFRLAEIAAGAC